MSASVSKMVQVTLKKSPIGTPVSHRLVLQGLGLRKINSSVTRPHTDQVKGMIDKVSYLVEVKSL